MNRTRIGSDSEGLKIIEEAKKEVVRSHYQPCSEKIWHIKDEECVPCSPVNVITAIVQQNNCAMHPDAQVTVITRF